MPVKWYDVSVVARSHGAFARARVVRGSPPPSSSQSMFLPLCNLGKCHRTPCARLSRARGAWGTKRVQSRASRGENRSKSIGLASTVTILFCLSSQPAVSRASTVVPADISVLAKAAKVIFAGTVTSLRSEWTPEHTTIVTKVSFQSVVLVKGSPLANPAVLTISGGTVGDVQIGTEGQPQFVVGERYVLLCTSHDLGSPRNGYLPIIGLYQGFFPVKADPQTGRSVVYDHADRVVTSVEAGKLVVLGPDTSLGPDPALTASAKDIEFVPIVRETSERDSMAVEGASVAAKTQIRAKARAGTHPAGRDSAFAVDWVLGSQRASVTGEPAVRSLDAQADPGTRLNEAEFIAAIKLLMVE